MKTRIALIVLVICFAVLLFDHFRLVRKVNDSREKQLQLKGPIAQPIAATQQLDVSETKQENEQLRKHHEELIRLRNYYGLLRDKVDVLQKENSELRQKMATVEDEVETQRLQRKFTLPERQQMQKEMISSLEEQLAQWVQDSDQAKRNVMALAESANIPDGIAQLEASAVLKNPKLQQYWPYFEAQRELAHCMRVVDAIRLRIDTEKAELGTHE